ncbi:MAG: hypothetical protein IKG93_06660 [Clostridiales bacterium]|nr:hypothetical protein [Clostridiales bacterium]
MEDESEKYGSCKKCGALFYAPYLVCPFCDTPVEDFEKGLELKREAVQDRLKQQLAEQRRLTDSNRKLMQMSMDEIHKQDARQAKHVGLFLLILIAVIAAIVLLVIYL